MNKLEQTTALVKATSWFDVAFFFLQSSDYAALKNVLHEYRMHQPSRVKRFDNAFLNYFDARVAFNDKHYEVAAAGLSEALRIFKTSRNHSWHSNTILRQANDSALTGDYSSAEKLYKQALASVNNEDDSKYLIPSIQIDYAVSKFRIGADPSGALQLLGRVHADVREYSPHLALIGLLNTVAIARSMSDTALAIHSARKGIAFVDSIVGDSDDYSIISTILTPRGYALDATDFRYQYAALLVNYGNSVLDLGDHGEATDAYSKALRAISGTSYNDIRSIVANQLGSIKSNQGKLSEAEMYFEEALRSEGVQQENSSSYAIQLSNLAEVRLKLGQFEAAKMLYSEALLISKENNFVTEELHVLSQLGQMSLSVGLIDSAIKHLTVALKRSQKLGIKETVSTCFRLLGMCHMQGDTDKALDHLQKALVIAQENSNAAELELIHKELISYYKMVGELNRALIHYERYTELKEKLYNEKSEQRVSNLTILHRVNTYKVEQELTKAKTRELELELESRVRELGSLSLRISEKQEMAASIERDIQRSLKLNPADSHESLREMLSTVRRLKNSDKDIESMDKLFRDVHQDAIQKIIAIAPDMSQVEVKICVMLMKPMNTNQVADAMNLSYRYVENCRGKIRKKLKLAKSHNLLQFLRSLS